ncbi:PREDICTED: ATP synthase subunit delta, mitochondrial-like [Rhagoletis zephyria]|uniref:ATP synthase subunit delta, mitochondrial-like n=1 Tax=Rhagoletis zephyria TaxID=28612 RepID=UPI0008113742|nr:PREDICTED: ATP synthase subunit delta, mitochondrial-like [Rhagoletis zephyria]
MPYQALACRTLADNASGMPLTFSSPYEVFYNAADVKQVDVPSFSGSFGILPKHVPLLAVLKPGVVTVYENEGAAKKFFVSSGTVTINDDSSVQVLAEEAVPLDSLDAQAAREALSKAQQQLSSATDEVSKAEAQIAVEVSEAIVAAAN